MKQDFFINTRILKINLKKFSSLGSIEVFLEVFMKSVREALNVVKAFRTRNFNSIEDDVNLSSYLKPISR